MARSMPSSLFERKIQDKEGEVWIKVCNSQSELIDRKM
jgi:hypothetical protein